jgi:hypothetical protein
LAQKKKKKRERAEGKPGSASRAPREVRLETRLSTRYQVLICAFLLIVGICLIYPELVFQNKVFTAGDVEAAASFATAINNEMAQTSGYPLWNPYVFAGMPSFESLSYTPYVYPVGFLTHVLAKYLFFPNSTWLLLHIWMLGLGVCLLLMGRKVHFLIAAGAGILMMWMPNHVAVGAHGHGSQASAVGYVPFVLMLWDRVWRGKAVVLSLCGLIILLGFQMLRAHLQITYYTFAILGLHVIFYGVLKLRDAFRSGGGSGNGQPAYSILRRIGGPTNPRKTAFLELGTATTILALIVAGALFISAVLFLPVQDYAPYSIRGASEGGGLSYDYATSWSLHPAESLTFVVPSAFGFGRETYFGRMPFTDYPNYLGLVVALFAVVALFKVKTRFVRFLLFLVIVSTIVAFGKYLPVLYNPLFNYLPYFNKFRVPVMVLIVQQFAVVLLFGLGLSAVIGSDAQSGRRKALWGLIAAVALFVVFIVSAGYWTGDFPNTIAKKITRVSSVAEQSQYARMAGGFLQKDLIKLSLVLLASTALLIAFFRRMIKPVVFVALTIVVAMIDIYMVSYQIVHPDKMFKQEFLRIVRDKPDRDRFLNLPLYHPQNPFGGGDFSKNRYMNFGIPSIAGYHPAKLSIYDTFLRGPLVNTLAKGNFKLINMLNTKYLITSSPFPDNPQFRPVWRGADYSGAPKFVYQNLEALPRVFLVDKYQVMEPDRILGALAMPERVDFSRLALLEREPSVKPVSAEGAEARITDYSFNEIRVDAKLPSAAILILGEVFYPRWQVLVDGEPYETLKANYVLRAVALPAGTHEIVFRYDASLLKRALSVSAATLGVVLFVMIVAGSRAFRGRNQWKHSS